jgi:hypothetical protein
VDEVSYQSNHSLKFNHYSSVVISYNTVTIAPNMVIPTGIKYGRSDAQTTFN